MKIQSILISSLIAPLMIVIIIKETCKYLLIKVGQEYQKKRLPSEHERKKKKIKLISEDEKEKRKIHLNGIYFDSKTIKKI